MSLRKLDRLGFAVALVTCVGLGAQQVAVKLALPEFSGLTQAALRSAAAIPLIALWLWLRDPKAYARDGTLGAGLATGVLFGFEFLMLYLALEFTTSGRAATFLYTSPLFTALGLVLVMPNERLRRLQWLGLALSFIGVALVFGVSPATSARMFMGDLLALGAALAWACTTLVMKATRIRTIAPTKALLYQLVVSVPVLGIAAWLRGETWPAQVSWITVGALAYQTVISVVICFSLWFWLIKCYRAGEVTAFTFFTPVFGVLAGALVLGESVAPGFAAAVALVALGILLVTWQPKNA
jgi:drug/metabolite transporter (DMT)-like permease